MKPQMNPDRENRLARARSPYLLQHKDNPVDWYEWGEEAFARATREERPVFLSIGYSSCHWCHVMEHESFEDEEVARVLNERFVSIKVDREERPDVDEVYMRVTTMLTGHGGWPMTVFLTPERKPFFAGTYFPKRSRLGMTGLLELLDRIADTWKTRRGDVERSAAEIAREAARADDVPAAPRDVTLRATIVRPVVAVLERRFDAENGGFGGAPKFPPHQALRLLLSEREAGEAGRRMALVTLEKMAAGGIHDHVGGGFHRYSVDDVWHVPHFEKMLYDNALLARAYVDAFALTKDERWRDVARGIFAWVRREMTGPEGGFFSALDADSEGVEGKHYVWTPAGVAAILGEEEGRAFCRAYDITEDGNWEDGNSIPRRTLSGFGRPGEEADPRRFAAARAALYEARAKRVRPGLDDKVLVSWNGLMIGALARGFEALAEAPLKDAAERAARSILARMRDSEGRLLRVWRAGDAGVGGFLEDYAYLAEGLLDLHAASFDSAPPSGRRSAQDDRGESEWLAAARALGDSLLSDFEDPERGGFFHEAHGSERLLFRSRDPFDGAMPSANGVAVRALVRLGKLTGEARYTDAADRALRAFAGAIQRAPHGTMTLTGALALRGDVPPGPVSAAASARPAGPVTATARIDGTARAGGTVTAVVEIEVAEKFHLAAPLDSFAVASRDIPLEAAGAPELPPPEELKTPFEGAPAKVYRGRIAARVPIRIKPHALAGAGKVRIAVRVQACDEKHCLAPEEVAVEAEIEVAP